MDTSNFKEVFTSDEVKKLRAENEMLYYEAQRLDSLATDFAKRTEYWIGRCDSWQNDCEQLRQRVAELEKERDEWRGKHDVACLTITSLQSKYECQLSATSKAMQGVTELTAERDALTQQRDELLDLVKYFINEVNEVPMTSSQYELCRQAIASVKEK